MRTLKFDFVTIVLFLGSCNLLSLVSSYASTTSTTTHPRRPPNHFARVKMAPQQPNGPTTIKLAKEDPDWPVPPAPSPDPNVLDSQRRLKTSAWPLGQGSRNDTKASIDHAVPEDHAVVTIPRTDSTTRVSKSKPTDTPGKTPLPPYDPVKVEAFTAVVLCLLVAGFVAVACVFPYQGNQDEQGDDRRWEVTLAKWFAKSNYPPYAPLDAFLKLDASSSQDDDTRTTLDNNSFSDLEGIFDTYLMTSARLADEEALAPSTGA